MKLLNKKLKIEKMLRKICLNQVVGANKQLVNKSLEEMTLISGQKATATSARKSISNFKVMKGQDIGSRVTLRGEKMIRFLNRLISFLPEFKDFRGISKTGFDGDGNYTLGVNSDLIPAMDITFVSSNKNDTESYKYLLSLGLPFEAPIRDIRSSNQIDKFKKRYKK